MNEIRHIRIEVEKNEFIHAVYKNNTDENKGCIIFSHGFGVPGFESHRMFWEISDDLVAQGFSTIMFDYRGSGYSDKSFEEMTIDTEIKDLNVVIDYVKKNDLVSNEKIILWGQSFGSGVASLVASSRKDINAIILWCLSAELYNRYTKTLGSEIITNKYVYLGSGLKVSLNFLESLKFKDVYNAIRNLKMPLLLIHGTDDEKASVELSKNAYNVATCEKEIYLLDGGNHGFKCQPEIYEKAKNKSYDWLKSRFN